MACIWSGAVSDLKRLYREGTMEQVLLDGTAVAYGPLSSSEVSARNQALAALLRVLDDPRFDPVQIILELQMPIGAERADVLLLGGSLEQPCAYILELKQWSQASVDPQSSLEALVPGFGIHQHPSVQVLNYRGKLQLFHSRAERYGIRAAVFLPNMNNSTKQGLQKHLPDQLIRDAPLYSGADDRKLAEALADFLLPAQLPPDEHSLFANAPYEQTRHLFEALTRHAKNIANNAVAVLAEHGIGLTEEQERLVEEILISSRRGEQKAFIVQGGPGSGKTLLAVTLLLRAIKEGKACMLALRNNRLQAILRRCFDQAYPGASGMMAYFEVPRSGTGVGDEGFKATFDLLICDEAQRMRAVSMPTVLRRAPVSVVFLDEGQRLNPPEQGTIAAFEQSARSVGRLPVRRNLTAAIRSRGGQAYHDWVEALLQCPPEIMSRSITDQPWRSRYQFEVHESIQALVTKLAAVRDETPGRRVALVASFTEAPGSLSRGDHPDNVRIGYPLSSGFDLYRNDKLTIRWLMRPEEYVRFWMHGHSNRLDQVASIYGAQGFESDYVGVIWGRDLVIRDGQWSLGPADACYDMIDGLVSRGARRRWAPEALELLKNRYRIFLTRGILGTFVFCEDAETRRFLLGLGSKDSP